MEESLMLPEPYLSSVTTVDLAGQIEQIVRLRTGGSVYGLQVEVDDGAIILNGQTSTYYNKQLATHAAQTAAHGRLLSPERGRSPHCGGTHCRLARGGGPDSYADGGPVI